MSSATYTMSSRIPPRTTTSATKLRQTCDPCSEAKVKCDKGNPRCGRCDRLSYDCVYSPARRIGRPRPRRSPEDQDRDLDRDRLGDLGAAARKDLAPALVPSADHQQGQAQQQRQQQISNPRQRNLNGSLNGNILNLDVTLPDDRLSDEGGLRWSAIPANAGASGSATANRASSASGSSNRSNDAPHSTSTSSTGTACTNMSDGALCSFESSSLSGNTMMGMEEEVRHNHNHNQNHDNRNQNHNHSPYEDDCAIVAVATLRRLSASPQTTAAAEVLADQIPHACRQAARILVCPCSTDLDTALLCASLLAAILDVADAALRTLKPAGHALDDEQHTVLALGTLPSLSQVVTLFTHRYSVTQQSRPPEALLLLAASLRTMLKAMAEETTNRFLESGSK